MPNQPALAAVVVSHAGSGNRCDHDPLNPRLDLEWLPERRGNLPIILQLCLKNLKAYYYDRSILRTLAELDAKPNKASGGVRSNRSEAREAEVLIITAILNSLDLTSMLVGTPKAGGFVHRSTYELAKMAGFLVDGKPHSRFKRVMMRLRRAGYMETTRTTYTNEKGEKRASTGIRRVSDDFIVMLMGGTEAAAESLRKAKSSHYSVTKARRAKGSAPSKSEQREKLDERMKAKAAAIAEQDAAKKAAKNPAKAEAPAIDLMSPEGHQRAYNKARQEFQKQCLDDGLDFHAIHAAMTGFPTLENWAP